VNINGNAHAPELDYDWIGEKPKMLLGTDYLLMREEFRELAKETPPWRDPPERAIVTFGGSDVNNSTPDAVRAFDGFDLEVDAIIGPGFENEDEIRDAATETDAKFNLLKNPDDLPRRMFEADLAVSATGSTIYELLATGTPTICAPQSDNQRPVAESLEDTILRFDTNSIQNCLLRLTEDSTLRQKMREDGKELIDAKGVQRVYSVLSV
jgi:spore coat polysaccharide biosynthesis predicted glycosyltransferase SpsG